MLVHVPTPKQGLSRTHLATALADLSPTLTRPWPGLQVLQDRGESGSRHGRATFAVLLLQVSLTVCDRCLCVRQILHILQHCTSKVLQG